MPLTEFQKIILRLIAANRSPESYLGGGASINSTADSPRYSADLDLFHDAREEALRSAERDVALIEHSGYRVTWLMRQPGFCRVVIEEGATPLKLEWVYDTAFRFFPVITDPDIGYRLHPADVAVNKVLAAGGRRETRDFVDLLYLHTTYLELGALIWAACGKDPGFSPESLLEQIDRNKLIAPPDLAHLEVVLPIDPIATRTTWIRMKDEASALFEKLPVEDLGCLYLDKRTRKPATPSEAANSHLIRHFGSVKGSWPRFV